MSGGTILLPNPPRVLSRWRRAVGIAGDLVLAVAVVWAFPLAVAIVAALIRLAWAAIS